MKHVLRSDGERETINRRGVDPRLPSRPHVGRHCSGRGGRQQDVFLGPSPTCSVARRRHDLYSG